MIALVLLLGTTAWAERRRVVVLDFEGDKAEKFHDAVAKVIRKTHTVIATDKWNEAATEMSAEKINDKNVKKIAKKLKADAVVEGKVEKRRDEYIIRIKLRSGSTGEVVKPVNTKAENTKLDGDATDSIKDELVAAISELESVRGGKDDDDEKPAKKKPSKADDDDEKPAKKKPAKSDDDDEKPTAKKSGFGKKADDDEKVAKKKPAKSDDDDEKPAKKKPAKSDDDEKVAKKKPAKSDDDEKVSKKKPAKSDDDEKVAKKKPAKSDDDDEKVSKKKPAKSDDDEKVAKKDDDDDGSSKKKSKKVASKDDGEVTGGVEVGGRAKMDPIEATAPGERALDAVIGASFNARRLAFTADSDLGPSNMGTGRPPSYKGLPVAGLLLDMTIYPLAIGHKSEGITKHFGLTAMYDKVLVIKSKDAEGNTLGTSMGRYAIGAAFRYPLGKGATAPVIGGKLRYGRQNFTIDGAADIPNVNYTMIEPSVFFRYPLSAKMTVNIDAGFLAVSNTGAMQRTDQYGPASVTGFEGELGVDYRLGGSLFARAAFRAETIGMTFKGQGMMTTGRDNDADVDVRGARDTYLGGIVTVGYLY